MRSALFCDVTQHTMVIRYRRFGTTNRPHFKGQEIQAEGQEQLMCSSHRVTWGVAIGVSKHDASQEA
jgi:hypothetical protein